MPRRFGFDSAGLGFDLGPFAPDAPEEAVEASRAFGAASGGAEVSRRDRTVTVDTCYDIVLGAPDTVTTESINWFNFTDLGTNPSLPAAALVGTANGILILLGLNSNTGQASLQTFGGTDLLPAIETGLAGIRLSAAHGEVSLGGPDAPDSIARDPSLPYGWTMSAADQTSLSTWLGAYTGGSVTLRLCLPSVTVTERRLIVSDTLPASSATSTVTLRGLTRIPITADRSSGAGIFAAAVQTRAPGRIALTASRTFTAASAYTTTVQKRPAARVEVEASVTLTVLTPAATVMIRAPPRHFLRPTYDAPSPTFAPVAVQRTDLLQLTDFPLGGLTAEWLVLLVRTTTGTRLYRSTERGGNDTPLDGEIGLTSANVPLTEIRITRATNLLLNDSDSTLALSAYFGTNGDGQDLSLWAVNDALEIQGTTITTAQIGGNFANLTVPTAFGQLLQGIGANERWIFAGTRVGEGARHVLRLGAIFPTLTDAINLQKRAATRHALSVSETYPAPGHTTELQKRTARRIALTLDRMAHVKAVYTAPVQARQPAVEEIRATHSFGAAAKTVSVSVRALARHLLTVAGTRPALTSTAAVQKTTADRHAIIASETYPAKLKTVSVQLRTPGRKVIAASGLFDPPDVATTALANRAPDRNAVAASGLRPAFLAAVSVVKRLPVRRSVTAGSTFAAASSTVALQSRILLITATKTLPAQTAATGLQTRAPDRHAVSASESHEAITAAVTVAKRLSDRHVITAVGTFLAGAAQATVYSKTPVSAAGAFGALTTSLQVSKRFIVRHQIEADETLAAPLLTGALQKRSPGRTELRASALLLASVPVVQVSRRNAPRSEMRASETHSDAGFTAAVQNRLSDRHSVEADGTFGAISATTDIFSKTLVQAASVLPQGAFTAAVQRQTRDRHSVEADATHVENTATVDILKRLSARRPITLESTLPAWSTAVDIFSRTLVEVSGSYPASAATATVQTRVSARREIRATSQRPESVFTAEMRKTDVNRHSVEADKAFTVNTANAAVQKRAVARKAVEAAGTFPATGSTATVFSRSVMERLLEPTAVFGAASFGTTLQNRQVVRHVLTLPAYTASMPLYAVRVQTFVAGPVELRAAVTYPEKTSTAFVNMLTSTMKAVEASEIFPASSYTGQLFKGNAMPPGMVIGLMLIAAGYRTIELIWQQPDIGTGRLLHYEYRIGSGSWISTQSPAARFIIQGLDPGTEYSISVRAVSTVGRGSGSAPITASTLEISPPSVAYGFRAEPTGKPSMDLSWTVPNTDGGGAITHYEVCVIYPDGTQEPFQSTGNDMNRHRVRGLALGQRYGFRVRGVNSAGAGQPSGTIYGTPARLLVAVLPSGERVPLIDADRQSVIVRLADMDCRVRVWWQPSDSSWYGSLEVPVNTVVVQSVRLALNSGLLDRLPGVLPGNLVLRELGSSGAEPQRDAFTRPTHAVVWREN